MVPVGSDLPDVVGSKPRECCKCSVVECALKLSLLGNDPRVPERKKSVIPVLRV